MTSAGDEYFEPPRTVIASKVIFDADDLEMSRIERYTISTALTKAEVKQINGAARAADLPEPIFGWDNVHYEKIPAPKAGHRAVGLPGAMLALLTLGRLR